MTRLSSYASCAVAVLVVATVALSGGVGSASAQSVATIAGTQIQPDDVSLRVAIRPDGSARWTVEYRIRLDTANETAAFESIQSDVRTNASSYVSEFRSRMEATAATAENATGREMGIGNVTVSTSRQRLPQEYGIVTYEFTWTNFAAVDGETVRAGDALAGFFLTAETSLLFTWPAGYDVESVSPDPSDRRAQAVVWDGPVDFAADEPRLVLVEAPAASATTTPAADGGDGPSSGVGSPVIALILLVAGIVGGGGWMLYRRRERRAEATVADPSREERTDSGGADDAAASARASDGDSTDDGRPGAEDATDDDARDAESADRTPWEDDLLSNEERVLALIEHEGGRLKQQEVARTLEWTDAKTSQVVRKMRDEGTLDAFRLGRENVLVLPGEKFGPNDDPQ
jgi:hypothetical protein